MTKNTATQTTCRTVPAGDPCPYHGHHDPNKKMWTANGPVPAPRPRCNYCSGTGILTADLHLTPAQVRGIEGFRRWVANASRS